jgi:hypothetical protein
VRNVYTAAVDRFDQVLAVDSVDLKAVYSNLAGILRTGRRATRRRLGSVRGFRYGVHLSPWMLRTGDRVRQNWLPTVQRFSDINNPIRGLRASSVFAGQKIEMDHS